MEYFCCNVTKRIILFCLVIQKVLSERIATNKNVMAVNEYGLTMGMVLKLSGNCDTFNGV